MSYKDGKAITFGVLLRGRSGSNAQLDDYPELLLSATNQDLPKDVDRYFTCNPGYVNHAKLPYVVLPEARAGLQEEIAALDSVLDVEIAGKVMVLRNGWRRRTRCSGSLTSTFLGLPLRWHRELA